jgi:predicted TIM-barrel fold metal-dependent hydrolase
MTVEKEEIFLHQFKPKPRLQVKATRVLKPRFPVIDAHNHLAAPFGGGWDQKPIKQLLDLLDEAGVIGFVDLDGGFDESLLYEHLELFKARAPDQFRVFGGVDWFAWKHKGDGFPDWAAKKIREQVQRGADGLKIWKPFGLEMRDHHDQLLRVNDPRLDVIWHTAGELDLPVLIHVADPVAFFDPLDETNERWEELQAHPDWQFPSPPFPSFLSIMEDLGDLVSKHPKTTFIGAHVGCYAENLAWVGELLRKCSNFNVDISGRIGELGRQPYSARKFFLEFADRILFGLDLGPDLESYRIHYRFLETEDEYFNYGVDEIPTQGRWCIYGLALPDDVLRKVYHLNAQRLIFNRKVHND